MASPEYSHGEFQRITERLGIDDFYDYQESVVADVITDTRLAISSLIYSQTKLKGHVASSIGYRYAYDTTFGSVIDNEPGNVAVGDVNRLVLFQAAQPSRFGHGIADLRIAINDIYPPIENDTGSRISGVYSRLTTISAANLVTMTDKMITLTETDGKKMPTPCEPTTLMHYDGAGTFSAVDLINFHKELTIYWVHGTTHRPSEQEGFGFLRVMSQSNVIEALTSIQSLFNEVSDIKPVFIE